MSGPLRITAPLALGIGLVVVALGFAIVRLARTAEDPESRVRAVLEDARAAVEARDPGRLAGLLAEDFRADRLDRRQALALVSVNLSRATWAKVQLARTEVELRSPELARIRTSVVLARGSGGLSGLGEADAGVWVFELELAPEGGEWRFTRASWRRGSVADAL